MGVGRESRQGLYSWPLLTATHSSQSRGRRKEAQARFLVRNGGFCYLPPLFFIRKRALCFGCGVLEALGQVGRLPALDPGPIHRKSDVTARSVNATPHKLKTL